MRQVKQTDRQTERERGREKARESLHFDRGEAREFPGELDSFYIWSDWSIARISAAPHSLGCSREKSGPLHLRSRLVQLTAKRIQSYSIIWSVKTV